MRVDPAARPERKGRWVKGGHTSYLLAWEAKRLATMTAPDAAEGDTGSGHPS